MGLEGETWKLRPVIGVYGVALWVDPEYAIDSKFHTDLIVLRNVTCSCLLARRGDRPTGLHSVAGA